MKNMKLWLQMFGTYPWDDAGTSEVHPINVTTQASMADTMKTYYSDYMLKNFEEHVVFSQFARKERIHGKQVEWRKFNTLPNASQITEGVIPDGTLFGITAITADVTQHGMYVPISDRLDLESFDPVTMGVTKALSNSKIATYETLTRNVIVAGTNVMYAPKVSGGIETPVLYRKDLDETAKLTSDVVARVATTLETNNVPKINDRYVGIIHPSQAYDLRQDKGWLDAHVYQNVKPIYNNEVGELHGVRFVVDPKVKVFKGEDLTSASRNLSASAAVTADDDVPVNEAITADEALALVGREVLDASGNVYEIASATAGAAGSAAIKLTENITMAKDAVLYPAGGGAQGTAVYASLFFGDEAFAVVEPDGEGQEMIFKSREEIGGPLNQFGTIGYKFCFGAKILYEERLIRVETGSKLGSVNKAN